MSNGVWFVETYQVKSAALSIKIDEKVCYSMSHLEDYVSTYFVETNSYKIRYLSSLDDV